MLKCGILTDFPKHLPKLILGMLQQGKVRIFNSYLINEHVKRDECIHESDSFERASIPQNGRQYQNLSWP